MGPQQGMGGYIRVMKHGIIFNGLQETNLYAHTIEHNPNAVVRNDGLRIEPVTKAEMDAELAARKKPSLREK